MSLGGASRDMIRFSIGGRPVDPSNLKDAMKRAVLDGIRAQITVSIGFQI
jgi:hypothetical protein